MSIKDRADKKRRLLANIEGGDTMASENQETKKDKTLEKIPLELIREEKNIRGTYDEESITELSESLKANGLLQPITVSERDDSFIILYGHRRFLAAQKAGWTEIDCIVRKQHFSDEIERIIAQTIENEDREEVPTADKEAAVLKLETEYNLSVEDICNRFGKSRGWYSQIKGAHEFREQYGKLFEEAKVTLYTKEAYKMKGYTEEQVKQVIESLKSGDAKAGVLSETADSTKKETRGRKPKQKTETQSTEAGTFIDLAIGDEPLEITTHIRLNKDKTFTLQVDGGNKEGMEPLIAALKKAVGSCLTKQQFSEQITTAYN